jgi:hypothetical protein
MSNNQITREDFPFLVEAMNKKIENKKRTPMLMSENAGGTVNGGMSIPDPVVVNVQNTMTVEDYKACSMIMAVCQNMVQKSITDAAHRKNIPAADALKNMNAWVQAYVDFPFPFFNFKDCQSDTYKKDDFVLNADPDFVASIVNIKGVADLQKAVLEAVKKSSGKGSLVSYSNTERDFNYFGVITSYYETEISFRVVKFAMHMKDTNVKVLCSETQKTKLDTNYDTYQFVADKEMMIKMQAKMGDKMIDVFADTLMNFVKSFYEDQLKEYNENILSIL